MEFYTILTNVGKAKLANAQVMGGTVNLVQMALGDGGNNPQEVQTDLQNEVWRGNLNQIKTDEENPNWIVLEAVVPTADGGFTVREVGVFDEDGDLIAIGKYPQTYKPALDEGSGKDLYIRMILEVSNVSSVTLKINPAVVLASRAYVDEHEAKPAPHSGHVTKAEVDALAQNCIQYMRPSDEVLATSDEERQSSATEYATIKSFTAYHPGTYRVNLKIRRDVSAINVKARLKIGQYYSNHITVPSESEQSISLEGNTSVSGFPFLIELQIMVTPNLSEGKGIVSDVRLCGTLGEVPTPEVTQN